MSVNNISGEGPLKAESVMWKLRFKEGKDMRENMTDGGRGPREMSEEVSLLQSFRKRSGKSAVMYQ